MLRPALLLIASLSLACGTAGTGTPGGENGDSLSNSHQDAGPQAPLAQVGTGTDSFEPLEDGQTVPVIKGPQGGYHIWTSIRVRAPIASKDLKVRLHVDFNGAVLTDTNYVLNFWQKGAYAEYYALTAFIPDPAAVDGQRVQLAIDVTDTNGLTASDSRTVIPTGP